MKKINQYLSFLIASLALGVAVFPALAVNGLAISNKPCTKTYVENEYTCYFGSTIQVPLPLDSAASSNDVYYECGTSSSDCGPTMEIYGLTSEQSKIIYHCTVKNGDPYWKQADQNISSGTLNFTCWHK